MIRLLALGIILVSVAEIGGAQAWPDGKQDWIADIIGQVSQDSLRATIARLQQYGSRHWSMENRKDIALWIRGKMLGAGLKDVVLDSFQYSSTWQYNVVGTLPGSSHHDSVIIVGGHTDSYCMDWEHAPGADDNGSGTAAVLEAARVFMSGAYVPHATVRFIGFAAEEAGLRGSASYAGRIKGTGGKVSAMLNFDMIAHRNASSPSRLFSLVWYKDAEWLARLDSSVARAYTTLIPVLTTSVRSGSDSYSFWEHGYPALFHYERGSNPTYHTPNDILDSLDLGYAQDITRTGLATALTIDDSIGRVRLPDIAPQEFALLQNFPNPFNPGTTIRYDVSESRFVTITVYDMLGRLVATLVNEWKNAGTYNVRFNGEGLASGVYIYRLEARPTIVSRKMVLMR